MTRDEIMSAIAEFDARQERLISEAETITEARKTLQMELLKVDHGVSIGDLVTYKGNVFKVTSAEFIYGGTSNPWLYGCRKKTNGDFGKKPQCLFSEWNKNE